MFKNVKSSVQDFWENIVQIIINYVNNYNIESNKIAVYNHWKKWYTIDLYT